jgi:hypothetical protein
MIAMIVRALSEADEHDKAPALSFSQLQEVVAEARGRPVSSAAVRGVVYHNSEWFERVGLGSQVLWRLSGKGRAAAKAYAAQPGRVYRRWLRTTEPKPATMRPQRRANSQ